MSMLQTASGRNATPSGTGPTARCAPHGVRALWLGAAVCAASGGSAAVQTDDLAAELWQPRPEAAACGGAYVDDHAPPDAVTDIVRLRQGERWLTTHAAEVDAAGVALVDGVFDYGERGLRLRADGAKVDLRSGDVNAHDVDWVLTTASLRGHADQIHKQGAHLRFAGAALTRCPPQSTLWQVRAGDLEFDAERSVVKARHVRLHLFSVPVLYAPYARFPLDAERASGFLFPQVRYERDSGLDVALPYYLNLAPNYDATLAVRHMRERGTGLETEFRHLGARTRSSLGAAFLSADRAYNGSLARGDFLARGGNAVDFARADRWLWEIRHRGRRGGWTTVVDFAAVSDNDYFRHMDSTLGFTSQAALRQHAAVRYQRGGLRARVSAQGLQRLEPGAAPYRRLPNAELLYDGSLGSFAWSVDTSWASFRLPRRRAADANGTAARVEGSRLHFEPRLRLPLVRDWGFLTLAVGSRHTRYALEGNGAAPAEPRRDIHLASIDGGLRLERDLRGGRWLQTLEPRLRYFHQSHADQDHLPVFDSAPLTLSYDQLFHDNRFAGVDRIGDANEVAVGVTSRLRDHRGRELLTARLGAVARLRDPRVTLPNEDAALGHVLAADLGTEFGNMRLRTTLAWDSEGRTPTQTGIALAYRKDETRVVDFGYRRSASAGIEQTDISLHWPLTPRWRLFGRWNHDWGFGQMVEGFAGFRYADCCLEVKLLAHKTINVTTAAGTGQADRGVLVEFVLRGLGGIGGGVDARLARAIRGFRPSRAP